ATPLVLDLGRYVEALERGEAPDAFWSAYQARLQEPGQPVEGLLFEPLWPAALPGGYRLVEVRVLQEACCKALQLRYRRDAEWLDVFQ
ncbi:hypothetical protein MYX64_13255, partial [Nitrospinae bacterium AH_259_B05_G02_I21]|nr:hypothetical protein [Nitrospinae bacterium AH_259_B05_G02_I21]